MDRSWRIRVGIVSAAALALPALVFAQLSGHSTITLTKNSSVTGGASVVGALSKGSGTFVIDHPLDPKNKLLHDPFIEANPIVPEVQKGPDQLVNKGEYLFPEFYAK